MRAVYCWAIKAFIGVWLFSQVALASTLIQHNKISSEKESYQLSLLKLALSYSQKSYQFSESNQFLSQSKLMNDLADGKIDVAWVGTSSAYEKQFEPIRIPLFKGLLGYRIFLIKEGHQKKFDGIQSLAELAKLKGGQVSSWTDAKILAQAGLNIVTTNKYPNLFYMLEGNRFDYLPRSVYSPWSEMSSHANLNLAVEPNLMIVYTLPAYFFVNKGNQALKADIYAGLEQAIEDGSFDQFFFNHPLIKQGLQRSQLSKRIVLRVDNPFLPKQTPVNDKRLWFDIKADSN